MRKLKIFLTIVGLVSTAAIAAKLQELYQKHLT